MSMDDTSRQALMQPAVQESLRRALQAEGAQDALRDYLHARAKLLDIVFPAVQAHGLVAAANAVSNPIVSASVEAANNLGKVLTHEQVSDWLEQNFGIVPQPISAS
jgi:hypothetical protein